MEKKNISFPEEILDDLRYIKKVTGNDAASFIRSSVSIHLEEHARIGMLVGSRRNERKKPNQK
jgi:hypothetical protein